MRSAAYRCCERFSNQRLTLWKFDTAIWLVLQVVYYQCLRRWLLSLDSNRRYLLSAHRRRPAVVEVVAPFREQRQILASSPALQRQLAVQALAREDVHAPARLRRRAARVTLRDEEAVLASRTAARHRQHRQEHAGEHQVEEGRPEDLRPRSAADETFVAPPVSLFRPASTATTTGIARRLANAARRKRRMVASRRLPAGVNGAAGPGPAIRLKSNGISCRGQPADRAAS